MIISDSVIRLIEGVINEDSLVSESFQDDLYDYPVYTKPSNFRGLKVPDVLLSGDHKKIEEWRYKKRVEKSKVK